MKKQKNQNHQSLKWDSNGELSTFDLTKIYEKLMMVDPEAKNLNFCYLPNKRISKNK